MNNDLNYELARDYAIPADHPELFEEYPEWYMKERSNYQTEYDITLEFYYL